MIQQSSEILNQSSGLSGRIARGILSAYYGGSFCTCYGSNPDALKRNEIKPIGKTIPDMLALSVKPNPASDWVAIYYIMPEGSNSAIITITDLTGRVVYNSSVTNRQGQLLVDIRKFNSGTYFCRIVCNGISKGNKLIISR